MNTATVPRFPRTVAGLLVLLVSTLFGVVVVPSARAASAPSYSGRITTAYQYRNGTVRVAGRATSPRVCLTVNGACVRTLRPDARHNFAVTLGSRRPGVQIAERAGSIHGAVLDVVHADSPGARIVSIAKRYVGWRYTEGGASPRTGFDCSGLTLYVYKVAGVFALPHNAESQRHVSGMHHETRAQARPGDLIFYFSGGAAYHVAIYAGHDYQYAAATPRDGVRYQRIWSSDIEFRTDWH
jgi:cell wall-associated NlpC family hydrolase